MPIECSIEMLPIHQERFHALDKVVMRHAFDIHNSIGRLCEERFYQDELAARCNASGIQCLREVEIRARHGAYQKSYFLDMLVGQGSVYELKAVESLASPHQNQLINYLLITETNHGKLINFRPASVESRFVSTHLDHAGRSQFTFTESGWERCEESDFFKSALLALLEDWGVFLDINLYREALLKLLGGNDAGLFPVSLVVNGRSSGHHTMCLLNTEQAWQLTAVQNGLNALEST